MAQKRTNLIIYDFKEDIVKAINNSGLPIIVIEQIFNELQIEIKQLVAQTLQNERMEHQKALEEENSKTKEDNLEEGGKTNL